jgi:hypothetical protein
VAESGGATSFGALEQDGMHGCGEVKQLACAAPVVGHAEAGRRTNGAPRSSPPRDCRFGEGGEFGRRAQKAHSAGVVSVVGERDLRRASTDLDCGTVYAAQNSRTTDKSRSNSSGFCSTRVAPAGARDGTDVCTTTGTAAHAG